MKRYSNHRFRLNNQGSTLITVLICLAFIAILGSLMLSVTLTNLNMKIIESKSKGNFYSCETAMEEIRTGLQELTAQTIKDVYENQVLNNYASYMGKSEAEINTKIQNMVTVSLMKSLVETNELTDDELISVTGLTAKLDGFKKYLSSSETSTSIKIASLDSEGNNILIKDIKIAYEKDGYQTSITSNIRITLPKFVLDAVTGNTKYDMEQPFKDYVLVADEGITSSNSTGTNLITGSVYAGDKGILVKNILGGSHIVNIQGENIVTRGNITVSNSGNLTIGTLPLTATSSVKPIIWANNLVTETSSDLMAPVMKINGICIMKDDLDLNGHQSDVEFTGAYIGYSGMHTEKGSAIMVNGVNAILDLSGLSSLMLAGRANVSIEDTEKTYNIMTGESIAFKSNQRAYLLPGRFIRDILHNPVTQEDIASGIPMVQILPPIDSSEIDYSPYTAAYPFNPYKIAAKQADEGNGSASTLRYYYLNFGSGKQADAYLQEYFNKYRNVLNNTDPFHINDLKLPPVANMKTVGNAMSYSSKSGEVSLVKGLSSESTYLDDTALDSAFLNLKLNDEIYIGTILKDQTIGMLDSDYSTITHLLSLGVSSKMYQDTDQVVASILKDGSASNSGVNYVADTDSITLSGTDFELIKSLTDYDFGSNDSSKKTFTIIDGNANIKNNSVMNGFFIASGDITIGNGAQINGIVITTGEKGSVGITLGDGVKVNGRIISHKSIILGTDCNLQTNASVEAFIASIFKNEGMLLQYLFKNVDMTVNLAKQSDSFINTSNMITYENWRKNDDE